MWDQLAFDDAIEVAYEFAAKRNDTLLIITSDHGNSNPGLNGMGGEYEASNKAMAMLQHAKCSFEELPNKLRNAGSADEVRDILKAQLGIEINGEEAAALAGTIKGNLPPIWNRQHRNLQGLLGQILSNYNGYGWTGTSHTADYTWITALGTGREEFHGLVRNTDAFYKMLKLFGLSRNLHPVLLFDDSDPDQVARVVLAGDEILALCLREGGSLSGEHGIGTEKCAVMHQMFTAQDLALMKRVKAVFNPSDALNPDKMFPDTRYCYESKRRLTAGRRGAAV